MATIPFSWVVKTDPVPGRDYPDAEELRSIAQHPLTKRLIRELIESFQRHANRSRDRAT